MNDYLQNSRCAYRIGSLKPLLYVFVRGKVINRVDNDYADALIVRSTPPEVYSVRSVEYTEEASLEGRYRFRKTLTVTVDGYSRELLETKGILGIEQTDGSKFVINPDFDATVSYDYRLDADDDRTVYTFLIQSNWPSLSTGYTHKETPQCKGLRLDGATELYMTERENAALDSEGVPRITVPLSKVEYNRDSLVFTERVTDGYYTQTLSFDINLASYHFYWHYDMIEFLYNEYAVKIGRNGNGYLLCGWEGEKGMVPEFTIDASGRSSDIITMTFTRKGLYPVVAEQTEIDEDSSKSWEFVEGVGEHSAMVCVGVGRSMYTLKREINALGQPTGRYMQHVTVDYSGWGIDLVEEEFSEYKLKEDPDCQYGGCWWMRNTMPSVVEFNYPSQSRTFTLQNGCGFRMVNKPSWITASADSGEPEESVDITFTNNSFSAAKGYITILDAKGAAYTTKFVYEPRNIINDRTRSVTAQGQTLTFTLNVPIDEVIIYAMSDNLSVEFEQPNIMRVTIPMNSTGNARNLIVTLRDTLSGATDTATITQDRIYTKRVLDGYLCEGGNKYERYQIWQSYYEEGPYTMTGEYERGEIIEAASTDCTGEAEKWEDLGDYVCDGSDAYHAIMRYVSHDGGRTWEPSGEIRLGDPWETQVSCTETDEELRLSDKWQCLPNDYES